MALDPNWNHLEARNEESEFVAENKNIAAGSALVKPTIRGFSHGELNLSDSRYYDDRDKRYYPQSSRAYGPMGEWLEGSIHEEPFVGFDPGSGTWGSGRSPWSKETSTLIEKPSKLLSPLQRRWDYDRPTSAAPDRPEGEDSGANSERRGGDIDGLNIAQGKDAKATGRGKACASCRVQLIEVIRTPVLVD